MQVASAYEESQKQDGAEGSALLASLKLLKMISAPAVGGGGGGAGDNRAVLASLEMLRNEMRSSFADLRKELHEMEARIFGLKQSPQQLSGQAAGKPVLNIATDRCSIEDVPGTDLVHEFCGGSTPHGPAPPVQASWCSRPPVDTAGGRVPSEKALQEQIVNRHVSVIPLDSYPS